MRETANDFHLDNNWSVQRDRDIARYLSAKSPDARMRVVDDRELQRAGVDLVQDRVDGDPDYIDCIHDRNCQSFNFCFEWISNTTTVPQVPGKFNPERIGVRTDLIYYLFWAEHHSNWVPSRFFRFSFPEAVKWLGYFRYGYKKHTEKDHNKTMSFIIPIDDIEEGVPYFETWDGISDEFRLILNI